MTKKEKPCDNTENEDTGMLFIRRFVRSGCKNTQTQSVTDFGIGWKISEYSIY